MTKIMVSYLKLSTIFLEKSDDLHEVVSNISKILSPIHTDYQLQIVRRL